MVPYFQEMKEEDDGPMKLCAALKAGRPDTFSEPDSLRFSQFETMARKQKSIGIKNFINLSFYGLPVPRSDPRKQVQSWRR